MDTKKMKRKYILLPALCAVLLGTACNDSFMDRYPHTDISPEGYFRSVKDLETYTNGFYGYIGASYDDIYTDNTAFYNNDSELRNLMKGLVRPDNIGSWYSNYGNIRNINFMLVNTGTVDGDPTDINHYVGIARLFRGLQYAGLVKRWNDVPWYSRPLETSDIEELYKPRDSRSDVMDSVLLDMQFAAAHIPAGSSKTRITRWSALAYLARTALYEGTFRKYHDELELQGTAEKWLRIARDSALTIIREGGFSLEPNYTDLFLSTDLSKSPEIILFKDYDADLGVRHNASSLFDYQHALGRELMNEYLYIDPATNTAKPFNQVPGYATMNRQEVFANRDPRLAQTFAPEWFIPRNTTDTARIKVELGGYPQIKFYPLDPAHDGWAMAFNDLPMIRYAEVLLIYAEACAELGELTQDVIDQTVNRIRQRVGVPALNLAQADANPDPDLMDKYPNVQNSNVGGTLEIRRERRVELACEGFRYDDVMRWKCGQLFARPGQGMWLDHIGLIDMSGKAGRSRPADFVDTGVFFNEQHQKEWLAANGYPEDYVEKNGITLYYLDNEQFYLSEGDHGYVMVTQEKDGGKGQFIEPKHYYRPLNQDDRTVNPNLDETIFW